MSDPIAPIRIAIIGLSQTSGSGWAAGTHLPALLGPRGQKLYKIVALCNSSIATAKKAILDFELPAETKAYGTPDDLANDPDIDMVLCSVRADKHYLTTIASVRAGKKAYIEWPVTASIDDLEDLVSTAAASKSTVAVGLQQRWTPIASKLRQFIASGELGKVLSSTVTAYQPFKPRIELPETRVIFTKEVVGANMMTISIGHTIDLIQSVIGEYVQGTTAARTQIQRPERQVLDDETKQPNRTVVTEIPDLVMVQGEISGPFTVAGASLAFSLQDGAPYPGEPALSWRIEMEKGLILVKATEDPFFQFPVYMGENPPTIQVQHFNESENGARALEWDWEEDLKDISLVARSVGGCLYAFAEGRDDRYVALADAAHRQRQIHSWWKIGHW